MYVSFFFYSFRRHIAFASSCQIPIILHVHIKHKNAVCRHELVCKLKSLLLLWKMLRRLNLFLRYNINNHIWKFSRNITTIGAFYWFAYVTITIEKCDYLVILVNFITNYVQKSYFAFNHHHQHSNHVPAIRIRIYMNIEYLMPNAHSMQAAGL